MRHFLRYATAFVAFAFAVSAFGQTTKWRDIYKAKKKDTIFGIARKYEISLDELKAANPEMKQPDYQLKKGDFVFIPFDANHPQDGKKSSKKKAAVATPTEETKEAKPTVAKSDVRGRAINVGVMLPLHDVDGDGRRMVEYYRGILLACDSLRKAGISTNIRAWNVNIDADIRQTLLQEGASDCDIIFGPLYTKQVKPLGDFCRTYDIKMVIPFSIMGYEVTTNPQIFQVYQSVENLNDKAMKAFLERFGKYHPIFVDCNDTTSRKGNFTLGLRKQLDAKGVQYSITNLKSPEDAFARAFSRTQPNVVILNTARSPELNTALARLNKVVAATPGVSISMFGYTEWLMYTKVYQDYFHKYDAYIPTTYYYNPLSVSTQRLEQNYRKWFNRDMQYALPRFAITGYDHAQFFLRGLHQFGRDFKGTKAQRVSRPMQTPLYFTQTNEQGGMQNSCFMLVHYTPKHTIESLNY